MTPTLPAHRLTLALIDPLGRPVTITAANLPDLNALSAYYGQQGLRPDREIPAGGLELPYAAHDHFNWALIGARPARSNKNGETVDGVWHDGDFYTRRVLDAVDSKKVKLPQAIKYSRGARSTDPEQLIERAEGEFAYRTLIIFRGAGRVNPTWQLRAAPAAQEAAD